MIPAGWIKRTDGNNMEITMKEIVIFGKSPQTMYHHRTVVESKQHTLKDIREEGKMERTNLDSMKKSFSIVLW